MAENGRQIEQQMQVVRRDIEEDAGHLAASASQLTDWRQYVRAYPWLCVGGVAAVGMLLAPKTGSKSSGKGSRRGKHQQDDDSAASAAASGTIMGLVSAAVSKAVMSYASKTAMGYVSSRFGGSHSDAEDDHAAARQSGDGRGSARLHPHPPETQALTDHRESNS